VPSTPVFALVAVQVPDELPLFTPPHVQVVVAPVAGKPKPKTYVTIPLPLAHIVPEKSVAVLG
jgi:hypothetical protein